MNSNRARDNAGKSEASWKKHGLFRQAVSGQLSAFRISHKNKKLVVIDFHAGDGEGVSNLQGDFFMPNLSVPTAAVAASFQDPRRGIDVILCERDESKRRLLQLRFPIAHIIADHCLAWRCLNGHDYALVINDPCGPADHGLPHMQAIAEAIRSDFVIAVNEGFVHRVRATRSGWEKAKALYGWIDDPCEWAWRLKRKHVARTPLIKASPAFHYRVLIIADHLSDAAKRQPFEVIQ